MQDSVAQEVEQVKMQKPHVVILGAGCSRAALPNGEASGRQLPLMQDFLRIVEPLKNLFESAGLSTEERDLEEIYSELVSIGAPEIQEEAEAIIFRYFQSLALPGRPTLYDHLVLGLREKDVIATFNWDPFLVQAIRRNAIVSDREPQLLFPHGNVMVGFCAEHSMQGLIGESCIRCGKPLAKSKLLYPIAEKNYDSDPMISTSWKQLRVDLEHSFMVTIFGYGAPASDAAAIQLLKEGFGDSQRPRLNQIEIIDVKPQELLWDAWEPFIEIHHYHYKTYASFYDSWIARHPRRTGEAYVNQNIKGEFISNNRIPTDLDFTGLWKWMKPLLDAEELSRTSGAG